jgi:hypothetical protein
VLWLFLFKGNSSVRGKSPLSSLTHRVRKSAGFYAQQKWKEILDTALVFSNAGKHRIAARRAREGHPRLKFLARTHGNLPTVFTVDWRERSRFAQVLGPLSVVLEQVHVRNVLKDISDREICFLFRVGQVTAVLPLLAAYLTMHPRNGKKCGSLTGAQ